MIRRLDVEEMDAAAAIHRAAFDERLPHLAGLHTPDEDRRFFRERVFVDCQIWGAFAADDLEGFIAFRPGWIDQLYVRPDSQGLGHGARLLSVAQGANARLQLWTFQRNMPARRFYEGRGFTLVRLTDGSGNEEREPDALYAWPRQGSRSTSSASG